MITAHKNPPRPGNSIAIGVLAKPRTCAIGSEHTLPIEQFVAHSLAIPDLDLTPALKESVAAQYHALLKSGAVFSVRHQYGWTFPDGEYFPSQFFIFSSGDVDFGLARLSHGKFTSLDGNIYNAPFCIIELIQGVQGIDTRQLPLGGEARRTMLVHLLGSCAQVVRSGWTVALQRRTKNTGLIDPYFTPGTIKADEYVTRSQGYIPGFKHFHILNSPHKNRGVRRVLGFERREHAASAFIGLKLPLPSPYPLTFSSLTARKDPNDLTFD